MIVLSKPSKRSTRRSRSACKRHGEALVHQPMTCTSAPTKNAMQAHIQIYKCIRLCMHTYTEHIVCVLYDQLKITYIHTLQAQRYCCTGGNGAPKKYINASINTSVHRRKWLLSKINTYVHTHSRYLSSRAEMAPVKDTVDELQQASSGLLLGQKIFAHICDFQIKWIACLRKYGHMVRVHVDRSVHASKCTYACSVDRVLVECV